ncbi:MAG: TonB-dependent receptor [Acidobacteria bacterium]|nr:TonB-dependent receptor [Acidobacteriota bacterium]
MVRRTILAFLLLLGVFIAGGIPAGAAQASTGTIEGMTLDPQGQRLPGSTVELVELGRRTISDASGNYRLPNVPVGQYTLRARAAGFEEVTIENVLVSAEETKTQPVAFIHVQASNTQIDVIGEDLAVLKETPGSAILVSQEELQASHSFDANEVLRRVPGVSVREDSGPAGMRLSLGIRGLNPDRSRQILVLEDGIPVALAPYGEPEMYYSPPIDRMRRVEILKGSGSILYGPQTIGGVLNFVTPDPPRQPEGSLELVGGQRGLFVGKASYGGSNGRTGALLSLLRKQGDGFRSFFFDINDVTAKFTVPFGEKQTIGIKLNVYDERSNSTYLGLTQSQFEQDPNGNAVPHDRLLVRRYFGSLYHQAVLNSSSVLNTTFFAYTTTRDWRRQDYDRAPVAGRKYLGVFGDESIPGGAVYLRNSTGNRNRSFEVVGLESRLAKEHTLLGTRSKLDAGIRYLYERAHDQQIDGNTFNSNGGVIRDDEFRPGHAVSLFAQNRFFLGQFFTLTPGVRLEKYNYDRNIIRARVNGVPTDVNIKGSDDVFSLVPGIGTTFQVVEGMTIFAGVHRGFAPPRVKDAIASDGVPVELDAELSWNYEVGARLASSRGVNAEATFFLLDFENQIIPASQSGGVASSLINAGETSHSGIELQLGIDFAKLFDSRSSFLVEGRHTYLPMARFDNGIYRDHRLPYAPENTFSLLFGYRHPLGFGLRVDGTYVGDQFADNNETVATSANGEIGLLPSYMMWNLSVDYEKRQERIAIQPFFTIKNLTDKLYISSRAPQGIQPGLFRQANFGVRFLF